LPIFNNFSKFFSIDFKFFPIDFKIEVIFGMLLLFDMLLLIKLQTTPLLLLMKLSLIANVKIFT